jgi:ankyrin repeat protein
LAHEVDVNVQNDAGRSTLHISAEPHLVGPLIAFGTDLKLSDTMGRTPIMVQLLESDRYQMVAALLSEGACVHSVDAQGRSVLDYAIQYPDPATADLIQSAQDIYC